MAKKTPTRVCIVGPSLNILGGQAVQVQRLLHRLSGVQDFEISFLAVNPRLPGILRLMQGVKYLRTLITSIAYCMSLLRQIPCIDIVHAFSASYWSFLLAPVPAMLAGRLFQKRVILNYRSGEADDHLTHWRSACLFMRMADLIVVPSGYLVDVFNRHGLKAWPVANFVEVERLPFRQRYPLRPVFLSNRNFQAHYNVSCVLRAFARIQARVPQAELIIAGDGPLNAQLKNEADQLNLNNVKFVGAVSPDLMPKLYDKADVYLNTPEIDNMPNSILEAAACGLPIVTTKAGGIPYIIQHEVNGLLVSCNDDAAVADAALRLFNEPGLAYRLVKAAREEILCRYTWPAVEAKWVEVYELAKRCRTHKRE